MVANVKDAFGGELLSTFTVIRRAQSVNNYGRAQNTMLWSAPARGVIAPTLPDDLSRLPEDQYSRKSFSVYTTFPVQGPSETNSPDILVINGDNYIVSSLDDWSFYGPGFVKVIVTSMDSTDVPPEIAGVGQP